MPLLVVLTRLVLHLAEALRSTLRIHEWNREQQPPVLSLTSFLQPENESSNSWAKVKQQYKERQLHNGFSKLPWTGLSFKPCS